MSKADSQAAASEGNMDQFRRQHSISGGSGQDQSAQQPKFLCLTRCAGCYSQKQKFNVHWRGDESSSTSEDSESEAESSSSDSSCDHGLSETEEKPEATQDSPGSAVGGDEDKEMEETSSRQEDTDRMSGTPPVVNPVTLPSPPTPHLLPVSLLPHPPRIISVLNLQVSLPKPSSGTSPHAPTPTTEAECCSPMEVVTAAAAHSGS